MPLVEIKDFNALTDNKPFFDQPVKSKQEAYEKLIGMSRNNDHKRWNLLDYMYHQNYHKLIGIDLSRQTSIPQFYRKIRRRWCSNVFLLMKSSKKLF